MKGLSRLKQTTHTILKDALKYSWSSILTQEHTTVDIGKTLSNQHPITYISDLFHGSQLN